MNWVDAAELAREILGLPETDDTDIIEQALADRFEISLEAFGEIVDALIPLTIPARAALTGEMFQGFVKGGAFIVKAPAGDTK